MVDLSQHGGQPPTQHPRSDSGLPFGRALMVLVVFVAVTVALLSVIHPSKPPSTGSNSNAGGVATTTTTTGKAATTTTGKAATTTTGKAATTTTTGKAATTTTTPPSKVPVVVANGSGVNGAAATVSQRLSVGGWNLLAPINATAKVATSSVYYVAGSQASAQTIAASLHLPSSAVVPFTPAAPVGAVGAAHVIVVVGPDLASGSTAATTTTKATTTTTTKATTTTTKAN